jgi:peptidoglycan/xylan/chitin deacetylase (PgdA/CDA1 family)
MLIVLVSVMLATVLVVTAAVKTEKNTAKTTTVDSDKILASGNNSTQKTPNNTTTPQITTQGTTNNNITSAVGTTTAENKVTTGSQGTQKPVTAKRVAITFDDGPNGALTKKFVDKLKEYDASATFFVVGNRLTKTHKEAIQYVVDNGFEVGIHSYSHDYYSDANYTVEEYLADLQKTKDAILKYVDTEITLMRPPGGILTVEKRDACPYSIIMWSVDSEDWKYTGTSEGKKEQNIQKIVDNVMSNVKDGSVVLMHELYNNSYEAFCIIIEELYKQGYEVVSVSELFGSDLVPAKAYYSKK